TYLQELCWTRKQFIAGMKNLNVSLRMDFHLFYQVFRHGDHTPQEFFPTDKHKEVARQQGYGQLTKLGIQQQYELGQYMRRRYSYILSVVYKQCEIYVQSTDCDHTLMSAQASLAGLYPPTQGQIWNPRILWQPIPVHTVPLDLELTKKEENRSPMYREK
uniref:acid phosphatase n=1 Tax=Accipiter nisus TaxID=211598 RepID=A0A8B9LYV8_9AVES